MSELPPLTPADDSTAASPRHRRLLKLLGGLGLGLTSVAVAGGVVFYIWGNRIVTALLLPRVTEALNESIQRPVELGDVEGFSFWGVRLGETVIPATETDASSVTVEAIEIKLGLRSLIFQQIAKARVVLIAPELSLIEDEGGQWLELSLPEPSEAERPIELEIESVKVRNGSLSAVPYAAGGEAVVSREPVVLEDVDALVELFGESAEEITFRLQGDVIGEAAAESIGGNGAGDRESETQPIGSLALRGSADLEAQSGEVTARLKNLPATVANLLLPDSLGIRAGELDGNFTVATELNDSQFDLSSLDVEGTAQLEAGEFVVEALESPIQNIRSRLRFSGQQASISDTSLRLDETMLLLDGEVGLEDGYDLTAQIPSITVEAVQELADVELPVAAEGAFTLAADITGELDSPNLEGRLASLDSVLIDKVRLASMVADFSTALPEFGLAAFNLEEFRAQPTTGGLVTASGQADLSDLENLTFELAGNANVPTDGIAQAYGVETPSGVEIGTLSTDFALVGGTENQTATADWRLSRGLVAARGRARVSDLQALAFQLSGQATAPVDVAARAYGLELPEEIVLGRLSSDFVLTGDAENQRGRADWRLSRGSVLASGQATVSDLQQLEFELLGQASAPVDLAVQAYDVNLPEGIVLGRLNTDFEVTGNLEAQSAAADWRLSRGLISAQGEANASNAQQLEFQLAGQANAPVDAIAQAYGADLPDDILLGQLSADFTADGDLDSQTAFADWQLSQGSVSGRGNVSLIDNIVALDNTRLRTDEGSATATAQLDLETQNWRATASTDQIALGQFTTLASGLLNADISASGNLNALNADQIEASGNAFIADATVQLPETTTPLLERGDWTTAFEWRGDRIAINRFSAPGLEADGSIGVDFNRDIPIGDLALNVALQSYDLERINGLLPETVSQYAQLGGLTSFNGQLLGRLDNPQLTGNAQLRQLAVSNLEFEPLSGPIDFALADGGQINLQGQQEQLQLTAVAAPQKPLPFWPLSFAVRHQDFIARGRTEGDVLEAEIAQLPLERLAIAPAAPYGLGPVTGLLNAEITANLADLSDPTVRGSVTVTDPSLSPVVAERFDAKFSYADGTATLRQGELLLGQSQYVLSGRANLLGEMSYQGELAIAQGRIEDLISIAQALDLDQFGSSAKSSGPAPTLSAAELDLESQGVPAQASLLTQLERFVAFLEANPEAAIAARSDASSADSAIADRSLDKAELPPLDQLRGGFTGEIAFAGESLDLADASVNFDLRGDSWEWGADTPPNAFALEGSLAQSAIEIDTAVVTAGDTQVNLTAEGNLDQLAGRLVVEDLPVALAQRLYPLPVDLAGDLDLTTTFGGSLTNPQLRGALAIANPKVNDYLLNGIQTDFDYRNALLTADATVAVDERARPISVKGRVPYALPFAEVLPTTDQLAIAAVVPNGNLEIVNALTDEALQWQSGQGEIAVNVSGTLAQPEVSGRASFRAATVSSERLANDITDLSGDLLFNPQQIAVRQLQAQIDDGRILADGQLPLLPSGQPVTTLLTPGGFDGLAERLAQQASMAPVQNAGSLRVALEALPIDYDNLVSGVFAGQLLVTGAALAPTVTGRIEIGNGSVNATNVVQEFGDSGLGATGPREGSIAQAVRAYRTTYLEAEPRKQTQPRSPLNELLDNIALRNLAISLSDRLSIAARPVFRVTALGDLLVNGTLADPKPSGTIALQTGEVNLFSSQFRLDRGAPNTAEFRPENGLDPTLNVALLARVSDADINRVPPSKDGFSSSEINEPNLSATGEVRFIQVTASVQDSPASELTDNLTLTSRPARGEGEIVALLSNSAVTGLANASLVELGGFLGGGGGLTAVGDRIADAVGLQSFRVFPTTDIGEDSTGFGIGVEASAAIGRRFNVTVSDIINNDDLPQFGVFYRVSDDLNLRGESNLEDTNLELEYRIKF